MKKIIKLVERYFELDQNPPYKDNSKESKEAREKWAEEIWHIEQEVGDRIARRRELEQTPITEDWLKEHGWERNEMVFYALSKTSEVGIREFATLTLVNCYNKGWYVLDTPIRVNTLADLLDACELCGITMED